MAGKTPEELLAQRMKDRARELGHEYGITVEEYEAMKVSQGGKCALCKEIPIPRKTQIDGFHIDHDHTSGKVRALLCAQCNHGLGLFYDDPQLLTDAAAYVVAHQALQELTPNE